MQPNFRGMRPMSGVRGGGMMRSRCAMPRGGGQPLKQTMQSVADTNMRFMKKSKAASSKS